MLGGIKGGTKSCFSLEFVGLAEYWMAHVLLPAPRLGVELTNTLAAFSKHCEGKNRRGDGADRRPVNLGSAEWAILGAILAPRGFGGKG